MEEGIRKQGGQKLQRMNRRDRKKQQQEMIYKMDIEKLQKAFGKKLILQEKIEIQKVEQKPDGQKYGQGQNMGEDIKKQGGQKQQRMNRRDRKKQQQEMIYKMDIEKLQKAFGKKLILQEKIEIQKVEQKPDGQKYRKVRQQNQQQLFNFNGRGRGGRGRGRGRGGYRDPQNHFHVFQDHNSYQESQSIEKESKFQNKEANLQQLIEKIPKQHKLKQDKNNRQKYLGWQKKHHKKQFFQGNQLNYKRGEGQEKHIDERKQQKIIHEEQFQANNQRNFGKHRGHIHQRRQWKNQEGSQRQNRKKIKEQKPYRNDNSQKFENEQQRERRQDRKKQHQHQNQQQKKQQRQQRRHNTRQERQFKRNNPQNNITDIKQKVKENVEVKIQPKVVQHPEYLLCPISQILMQSPYLLAVCGHTFQETVIRQWLVKQQKCPLCNKAATQQHLVKNFALAQVCRSVQ